MAGSIEQILYSKYPKRFETLETEARQFSPIYGGGTVIRDGIFSVVLNYARKKGYSA